MPKKLIAGGHPADPENYCTVCKVHGGASLRGEAHPNFQNKGFSRYVPKSLAPDVEAWLRKDDPLNLSESIATWNGRVSQLLRTLDDSGDPGELWGEMSEAWERLWIAMNNSDVEGVKKERAYIDERINSGGEQAETWGQIKIADDLIRKLVDTEDKRRDREKGYIKSEVLRFHYSNLRLAVEEGLELIADDQELYRKVRRTIAEGFIRRVGTSSVSGSITAG